MEPNFDHKHTANLIDEELRLVFVEKHMASEPDTNVPVYRFRMTNELSTVEKGEINLRAGYTANIELYRGNIGFTVFENFRGHYLSGRSCLVLKPFIRSLGFETIWLTCNSDNLASKRNFEYIGALYVDTRSVPDDSPYAAFYPKHAREKLRYRWEIG
jgi:tagatose 1,6-diphosphate aldolase